MQTGIVRRIDELGRIVIPKEIRKTLRLGVGDPLEITADDKCLIFKKYSPVESYMTLAKDIANGIKQSLESECIITDTDKIIYSTSNKECESEGFNLSDQLIKAIRTNENYILDKNIGKHPLQVAEGQILECDFQMIIPITSLGDTFGSVIVYKNSGSPFNESDMRLAKLGAMLLCTQFEV